MAEKKDGPEYRYLAIRETLEQQPLPGMEAQLTLPFQTVNWGPVTYKVTGIVTNRDLPGDELIWWYRARCGKSEEAHSIMKEDLAEGKLPSQLFGAKKREHPRRLPAADSSLLLFSSHLSVFPANSVC